MFLSLLVISFLSSVHSNNSQQSKINQTQHQYQQILTLNNNNILSMEFILNNGILPFPIRNLTQHYNTDIEIYYGPYHHKNYNIANKLLTSNTITSIFKNLAYLPIQLSQAISSIFLISLSQRYHSYYNQINSTIYNDPNDKFCSHHIQQIIRNILPCNFHSGLIQILNLQHFFIGNKLYGMKILWNQSKMIINIEFEAKNKIDQIKKIKIKDKCLKQSLLKMSDAQLKPISIQQIIITRLLSSLNSQSPIQSPHLQPKLSISKSIQGNWYNPTKYILWEIQCQSFPNNFQLIMRQRLPARAGVQIIYIFDERDQKISVPFSYECREQDNEKEMKYNQVSVLCVMKLKITHEGQNLSHFYKILIKLQNKMISFDMYEHIFGGGTEIPQFPITITQYNQTSHSQSSTIYFLSNYLSLKTPQPDESLPFQTITFVLGIFGYLWIAIWRKFVNDISNTKKKAT